MHFRNFLYTRAASDHLPVTSVFAIPAFSSRLPKVPMLSSEASSPLPVAASLEAVLQSSAMSSDMSSSVGERCCEYQVTTGSRQADV